MSSPLLVGGLIFPQAYPMNWQPSASLEILRARACVNRAIRRFFADRDVLEVETPLLCRSTATDPHLASFTVTVQDETRYLQTSPEFSMKRLLAAGAGPIYQLCKAFRYEERGRLHNPEFTMLEWYRPGWTLGQLMDEVEALVRVVAGALQVQVQPFRHLTYSEAWQWVLGVNPHQCSDQELLSVVNRHVNGDFKNLDRNGLLDLLMSHMVEPQLPTSGTVVSAFPASQAALAKTSIQEDGSEVALRSELYLEGMEIANGYQELIDPEEQRRRFEADMAYRWEQGFSPVAMPTDLLDAMFAGLPETAGVALGVDRLMMALLRQPSLDTLIGFDWYRS